MRIVTLGTSHSIPSLTRFTSSTAYQIKDSLYLVDCGEPVEALLIRKGFDILTLRSVFITHMHVDHYAGIVNLIKYLMHFRTKRKDPRPVTVYFPEEGAAEALEQFRISMHSSPADEAYLLYRVITPGEFYRDENLTVNAIATRHMKNGLYPSYAFGIAAEGKRILHTGDLYHDFSDFPEESRTLHWDLCLAELTHYSLSVAIPFLQKADFGRLVFVHLGDKYQTAEGQKQAREALSILPYRIFFASDGDELTV